MNKIKYKIVFVNLHGTLLDDDNLLSTENIQMIKKIRNDGIHVIFTTSRPYKTVENFIEISYASPYIISSNGAIVRSFEKKFNIFAKDIDKKNSLEILEKTKSYDIYPAVIVNGSIVIEEIKCDSDVDIENLNEITIVDDLATYLMEVNKAIVEFKIDHHDKDKLSDLREELLKMQNIDVFEIEPKILNYPKSGKCKEIFCFKVTAKNVNKEEAIKALVRYLSSDLSETIAIGNGMEDISMFETVNYKVAVENADKELKMKANMLTATNNESGVAKALEQIFINRKKADYMFKFRKFYHRK